MSYGVTSFIRLLDFTTLPCGCVVGRYRELSTSREVAYVEEKGQECDAHKHRRNHKIDLKQADVDQAEAKARQIADEEVDNLGT